MKPEELPTPERAQIATDGSACHHTGLMGWGAVIETVHRRTHLYGRVPDVAMMDAVGLEGITQVAEGFAIVQAITYLRKVHREAREASVWCDCKVWAKWPNVRPIGATAHVVEALDVASAGFRLTVQWVRGHRTDDRHWAATHNRIADYLAKRGRASESKLSVDAIESLRLAG